MIKEEEVKEEEVKEEMKEDQKDQREALYIEGLQNLNEKLLQHFLGVLQRTDKPIKAGELQAARQFLKDQTSVQLKKVKDEVKAMNEMDEDDERTRRAPIQTSFDFDDLPFDEFGNPTGV
ncbi:MAG TPA: hypothetical protein P5098_00345 [Candidatus Dojkabacteria bacterium]|nr:hypothetical protein [Candidatus Dojkabacteria bacterium]